jgi:hypothetical protein
MADDTPTVETAKARLMDAVIACRPLPPSANAAIAVSVELDAAIDALIAAVRAEMQEALDTKERAHAMAIDREFAAEERITELLDEIDRLKNSATSYQKRGVSDPSSRATPADGSTSRPAAS